MDVAPVKYLWSFFCSGASEFTNIIIVTKH